MSAEPRSFLPPVPAPNASTGREAAALWRRLCLARTVAEAAPLWVQYACQRLGSANAGVLLRAYVYMRMLGRDGMSRVGDYATLNANYVMARLKDVMTPAFDGPCMHEALFDDRFLKDTGVTTLDFAKAMIDEGYHPMTMYFPLVVHGAMLIEPTETESKAELDRFCDALVSIARRATQKDPSLKSAPHLAPAKRLDETRAARTPVLRYTRPAAS